MPRCQHLPLTAGLRGAKAAGIYDYPLALTVMGGLMSSSILTLIVLPLVNLFFEWLPEKLKTVWALSGRRRLAEASVEAAEAAS